IRMPDDIAHKLKIIKNPKNYGYARGINVGLQEAKGEYVLVLNPDIVVFEGTIDGMIQYMKNHNDIAVLGPKLLNADKSLQYSCRRYPDVKTMPFRRGPLKKWVTTSVAAYEMHDFDHKEVHDVDWLCGGFLLIKKEVFEKVGLMDEFYFLYLDDVDFCRRAHTIGRVTYFPEVEAIHSASYESKKRLFPFLIHIRSMVYYHLKFLFFPDFWLVKGKGWQSCNRDRNQ
ncbi:MAG: glycosyltransferase family 2 protein, partial [Nanoarchaeota archaeon]